MQSVHGHSWCVLGVMFVLLRQSDTRRLVCVFLAVVPLSNLSTLASAQAASALCAECVDV
jgi:hypothetical protein